MKNFFLPISISLCIALSTSVLADDAKRQLLDNASEKFSEVINAMVSGEGTTEFEVKFNEKEEPIFSIEAFRDIDKQENSNFFTQFSLHNQDIGSEGNDRYILNFGLGKRFLNSDKSLMYGFNSFLTRDLDYGHTRGSLGFEAEASILEFNYNQYINFTDRIDVEGTNEQALSGSEYNLNSQIPYMPYAVINWQGYKHYADMATSSTKGDIYSLELALTPSLQLDLKRDITNHGDGNSRGASLVFVYPPRENKPTLADPEFKNTLFSRYMFAKANMEEELTDKVRRNKNLTVEIQGAVIITSK